MLSDSIPVFFSQNNVSLAYGFQRLKINSIHAIHDMVEFRHIMDLTGMQSFDKRSLAGGLELKSSLKTFWIFLAGQGTNMALSTFTPSSILCSVLSVRRRKVC